MQLSKPFRETRSQPALGKILCNVRWATAIVKTVSGNTKPARLGKDSLQCALGYCNCQNRFGKHEASPPWERFSAMCAGPLQLSKPFRETRSQPALGKILCNVRWANA